MNTSILPKETLCKMFGCTMEQLNMQYAANIEGLKQDKETLLSSGKKKLRGFTLEMIEANIQKFTQILAQS